VFSNFAERGIKTFAWDQRGFGRSAIKKKDWGATGGTDKALEDIDHFVKQVKADAEGLKVPVFIWGHSMVSSGLWVVILMVGRCIGIDVCREWTGEADSPRRRISITTYKAR